MTRDQGLHTALIIKEQPQGLGSMCAEVKKDIRCRHMHRDFQKLDHASTKALDHAREASIHQLLCRHDLMPPCMDCTCTGNLHEVTEGRCQWKPPFVYCAKLLFKKIFCIFIQHSKKSPVHFGTDMHWELTLWHVVISTDFGLLELISSQSLSFPNIFIHAGLSPRLAVSPWIFGTLIWLLYLWLALRVCSLLFLIKAT